IMLARMDREPDHFNAVFSEDQHVMSMQCGCTGTGVNLGLDVGPAQIRQPHPFTPADNWQIARIQFHFSQPLPACHALPRNPGSQSPRFAIWADCTVCEANPECRLHSSSDSAKRDTRHVLSPAVRSPEPGGPQSS